MSRKDVKAAVDLSISTKWVVKEGRHTFKNLLWSKVHEICTHPEADDFTFVIDSILQTGTREMYHTVKIHGKKAEGRLWSCWKCHDIQHLSSASDEDSQILR